MAASVEDDSDDEHMYMEDFDMNSIDPGVFESLSDELKIELLTYYKSKLKSKKTQSCEEFPQV